MRKIVFIVLFLMMMIACKKEHQTKIDVSNIDVTFNVARFEQEFYTSSPQNLPKLKAKYPLLFPHHIDSIWINKIKNKDEQELFAESQKIFKNFSEQQKQLISLFKHVKYYNTKFKAPKVITMLTNLESRVVYVDSLLFVSVDNFLGKNHRFYADFPKYVKEKNTKNHLIVAVANAFIKQQVPPNTKRSFLDKMIYEGKKMYLLDAYLPTINDEYKIGYAPEKMQWVKANEESVWKYFIDKQLLYSTDNKLNKRFLDVAPFSKFYLAQDTKSPGQIGVYIGWQIVRSFMQHNPVSLPRLMQMNGDEIFKQSKYKPKR